jgi:superoxide dismutase
MMTFLCDESHISFAQARKEEKMPYAAKDYSKLLGMEGFSETLLKNHFTLYQGYVTNTNKLLDTLKAMLAEGKTATSGPKSRQSRNLTKLSPVCSVWIRMF